MLLTFTASQAAKHWAVVPACLAVATPAVADSWLERGIALAIAVFVLKFFMAQSEKQSQRFVEIMERSLQALETSVGTFQDFERETRASNVSMLRILEKVIEQQSRLAITVERLHDKIEAFSQDQRDANRRMEELARALPKPGPGGSE